MCIVLSSYAEGLRFGIDLPVVHCHDAVSILVVLASSASQGRRIIWLRIGWWLIALWAVLIVWSTASNIFKGDSTVEQARRVVGRYFTSFTAMLAIVWCAAAGRAFDWSCWCCAA